MKNNLAIIDFKIRNMGMVIHPDHYIILEETNNLLNNNLPIPRNHIYTVFPEIFDHETDDFVELIERKNSLNRLKLQFVI